MKTTEFLTAEAKAKFPTLKKVFVKKITIVKNDINGLMMYRMPIVLSNGSKGYHHAYYSYC